MRKKWTIIILAVFAVGRAVSCKAQSNEIAFTHVAVVDVQSGLIEADMTVLISGQQIREVGSSKVVHVSKHARSIDARGKYLIPGLWDMHVHSLWDSERPATFFPLFLANGVTGVREMGGPMPAVDQVHWRNQVATGAVLGPHLVVPGPFVDGPRPVWPGSIKVSTSEEGRAATDSLKSDEVDFVKVYTAVPRPAYFGIAEEARKDGLPFAGHVPLEIGVDEASNAGQKSIEHLMGILLSCSSKSDELKADLFKGTNINELNNQMVDTYDPVRAAALFAIFVKNDTWQVPTLTIRHARPYLQDLQAANDPRLKYMPKAIVSGWGSKNDARQPTDPEILASRKRLFQKEMDTVGAMHRAGVKLLAGTDTPNPFCFPGFSIHDELGFMVQAGLTPLEALQTATINPAQFLGVSKMMGTIEKGKIADLVLLNANPLENIANTKRIAAVVSAGRLLERKALDDLLAGVATRVSSDVALTSTH
jgi:imidazolonepropionase-like amidohydrolase